MSKTANILRSTWKKYLFKNPSFWEFFPEYLWLKEKIEKKEIKFSCCATPKETIFLLCSLVSENPKKWKEYLKVDNINMYDGTKVISL